MIHFTTIHSTQISKVMELHYICKMFKMQISVVAECTYEMFLTKFTHYYLQVNNWRKTVLKEYYVYLAFNFKCSLSESHLFSKSHLKSFTKYIWLFSSRNCIQRNCKILIQDLTHQDLYMQRSYWPQSQWNLKQKFCLSKQLNQDTNELI